jgi:ABC-2 type transport system ATP-binding protein
VPAGIVFGFLGPNGAGKTTTIHLLLGLLEPTQGRANVLGFDTRTHSEEIRTRIGALLEFSGLYERMSAEDNLDFYGRVYHMSSADRRARIKELLTHIDLWDRRKDQVGNWSRGMKQKLAVARALLHHPPLIFLDEPTAGFDPVAAATLHNDLASLVAHEGVTVFLNTHNLTEAEKLCAQVGVIRQGRLLTVGNPDELRLSTGGRQVEIVGHGFTDQMLALLRERQEVANVELHSSNSNNSHLTIELRGEREEPALNGVNGREVSVLRPPAQGAHPLPSQAQDGSSSTEVGPLVSLIVRSGGDIEEVRRGKASLEDVFLTLMEEENK